MSEETENKERVLYASACSFARHSGPQSNERERLTFGNDLRTAALRYARAYYAEARELGLIPEYERRPAVDYRAGILTILASDMPGEAMRKALEELVGGQMSIARRKAAAKAYVESHSGLRSCGRVCRLGPVALAANGRALVTVQLVIDADDIEDFVSRASGAKP